MSTVAYVPGRASQSPDRAHRVPLRMQLAGDCGLNAVRAVCAGEGVSAPPDLYSGAEVHTGCSTEIEAKFLRSAGLSAEAVVVPLSRFALDHLQKREAILGVHRLSFRGGSESGFKQRERARIALPEPTPVVAEIVELQRIKARPPSHAVVAWRLHVIDRRPHIDILCGNHGRAIIPLRRVIARLDLRDATVSGAAWRRGMVATIRGLAEAIGLDASPEPRHWRELSHALAVLELVDAEIAAGVLGSPWAARARIARLIALAPGSEPVPESKWYCRGVWDREDGDPFVLIAVRCIKMVQVFGRLPISEVTP